jgi:hypothetical protein
LFSTGATRYRASTQAFDIDRLINSTPITHAATS